MRLFARSADRPWASTTRAGLVGTLLLGSQLASAIELDLDSTDSIKAAAKTCAEGMVKFYTGYRPGDVPGNLPAPYYWWEAGAMFGGLIDYWFYTGDSQFNEIVTQGMLHQVGPEDDYMPPNQTKTLGNDDQAFWGMAAMSAAENRFPDPPPDKPQWLALAQAVFNGQAGRWDAATCNGGLRWQIFTFNNGYNYKNTISNGCFFNLAARLAKYTGNQTYSDWADKMWDWTERIGLMSPEYQFFDGTDANNNCSDQNHITWSYNNGVYMLGVANMYNLTNGDEKWKVRLEKILTASDYFFANDIMSETACEGRDTGKVTCNVDQRSFKAYLSRWMAQTTKMAPFTTERIMRRLRTSAIAAARQCTGEGGTTCGLKWTQPTWDGSTGVGEQMSAMEVIQTNLISKVDGPVTNATGGTSKGDPAAGTGGDIMPLGPYTGKITTGDRVGAGFLTFFVLVGVLGGAWWMVA